MKKIPRGVWVLGFVSLFMDVSSEMIHALLPVFLVVTLGASAVTLGLIEGIAEATAQIFKLFSGLLSDRWRNRKGLALLGYGMAAIVKPLFPIAVTPFEVFVARFADRIGKGIRGAPRDALVADITPPELRGAAFGLRQSLDTVGAFLGPLAAIALMMALADNVRGVLWIAVIPAGLAVAFLAFGIREPDAPPAAARKPAFNVATARLLGRGFWLVALLGAVMMLARFSEAFLVLKASDAGLAARYVPAVLVVMSVVYSLSSYPAGVLSDRIGRFGLLAAGLAVLIAADLVLATATSVIAVMAGVALWGLHMGLTQGILATLVADTVPEDLRGTGFGAFNLVSGAALLAASVIAGVLWDWAGAGATFLAGAGFAAAALAGFAIAVRPTRSDWSRPASPPDR
ncbi:MAG TPA: MFS transporter [Aestuariivirga sp.]|nr:MFS transporter [Aestuariivirga sp.]